MKAGIIFIGVAILLFVINHFVGKSRPKPGRPNRQADDTGPKKNIFGHYAPPPLPDVAAVKIRPPMVDFHVVGEEARVFFSVVAPPEPDDVLVELMVDEAVEVVREKSHALPMSHVTQVTAYGVGEGGPVVLGGTRLSTPGQLPPRSDVHAILNLSAIAADPLANDFGAETAPPPGIEIHPKPDTLVPLDQELRLPRAVLTGLRAQGIDPSTMTGGEFLVGMIRLVGYQVDPGPAPGTFLASRGGETTFIREDPYRAGDHPEVDSKMLDAFSFEFAASQAAKGIFVSEKYGPFEIHDRERRNPRLRFLTRERLQHLVDGLAIG